MISNVSNHLSLTITKSRRIQDGAKSYASEEGQKLHGAKITPYTVARLTTVQAVANKPLKTRKTEWTRLFIGLIREITWFLMKGIDSEPARLLTWAMLLGLAFLWTNMETIWGWFATTAKYNGVWKMEEKKRLSLKWSHFIEVLNCFTSIMRFFFFFFSLLIPVYACFPHQSSVKDSHASVAPTGRAPCLDRFYRLQHGGS